MEVLIRPEEPQDRARVFEINAQAFESDAEAKLIDALRPVTAPLISLVAVVEERLVGHILFTPVEVESSSQGPLTMALGPMAVAPEHQRRGIGTKLVEAGLAECRALGAGAVFVLGHAEYYPRFGFVPAPPLGLRYKGEELDPYFMVLELRAGALSGMSGQVLYRPEFEEV